MKKIVLAMSLLLGMTSMANAQNTHIELRYVVIHKAGENWNPNLEMFQQSHILSNPDPSRAGDTHKSFIAKLNEEGRISLGGPMLDAGDADTGRVEIGKQVGMMISAPGLELSKEAWERIASEDPAVKAGVLSFEVREWTVVMKQR